MEPHTAKAIPASSTCTLIIFPALRENARELWFVWDPRHCYTAKRRREDGCFTQVGPRFLLHFQLPEGFSLERPEGPRVRLELEKQRFWTEGFLR
jgi:hypothetical protein